MKEIVSSVKQYCSGKNGVTESYPWKYKKTLGYKVSGKLFAAIDEDVSPQRLNVRCRPDRAQALKDQFKAFRDHTIHPHTWATIELDGSMGERFLFKVIDDSYLIAIKTLKKAERDKYL